MEQKPEPKVEQVEPVVEEETIQAPKVKKVLTDKQKEAMEKGRNSLKLKREQQLKEKNELKEQLILKKAEQVKRAQTKLKQDIGLDEEEEEEIEYRVKKSKPRPKKKIVYVEEEEEEEEVEEEYIEEEPKPKKKTYPPVAPPSTPIAKPRIVFW